MNIKNFVLNKSGNYIYFLGIELKMDVKNEYFAIKKGDTYIIFSQFNIDEIIDIEFSLLDYFFFFQIIKI